MTLRQLGIVEIHVSFDTIEKDFEKLSNRWNRAKDAFISYGPTSSLKLPNFNNLNQLEKVFSFLIGRINSQLALAVLGGLAELPQTPIALLKELFLVGDTGCNVGICLRDDLDDELKLMCETSKDPNVIDHWRAKAASRQPSR